MTDTLDPANGKARSSISRIFVNIAWLLGGKGFAAICSVTYLVILARTLGTKGFGHFSLITGTAQALSSLAGFQTWRVVVRYGVSYVHKQDWDRFGRLVMFCGLMDVLGAICGCLLAWVLIYGFGSQLSLNPAYVEIAFVYSCMVLWALTSTMTGVLRTLDRFDLMMYVETVPMVSRLIAALGIWWWGPNVYRFLIAWAIIGLIEALVYWAVARRLAPQAINLRNLRNCFKATTENPDLRRFCSVTYAGGTLDALTSQGPLLIVGAYLGTTSAGLYRLASQLAQSLSKLSTLLTRAVYPEVTRTHFTAGYSDFRKLAQRISLMAGGAGLFVVTVALVAGSQILSLIGGPQFAGGAAILVGLAVAASFDLASVAFEPVLHSTGRARLSLAARLMAVIALGIGLTLFIPIGPSGAAWAVALGGAVSYFAMGIMALRTLSSIQNEEFVSLAKEPGSTAD